MRKILIAVQDPKVAQEWADSFKQQDASWQVQVWTPDSPFFGAHYAVVWQPPAQLFAQEKHLKAVFNLGAGVDALGIGSVIPADIPVYRIEDGGMAVQMAEYALHGVLLATRRFTAYTQQQPKKEWRTHAPVLRTEWPVGVMGYGQIGAQVAKILAQLGYPVAAWARRARTAKAGIEVYAGDTQFQAFLQRTRILINVLPLTDATRGIINKDTLDALQQDSFVINMGRGAHVNDEDLLAALNSGQLRGALLDVFHTEPLPVEHPFWTQPEVHITPHIAGVSLRHECTAQILGKLSVLLKGQEPTGRVTPQQQY